MVRRDRMPLAWWVALLWGSCYVSSAQEITAFRLTGVEGYNNLRYVRDQFVATQPAIGSAPGATSTQGLSEFREELFVMTHSYIYHPNLLSLDIGFGPILQQSSFLTDEEETKSGAALYNFSGRAKFLRDKPYQGSVFYDHLNPTVIVAPGQAMTQQNTRYGADLALTAPFVPMPVFIDLARSHMQGRGSDRIIDDQIDQFNLRTSHSFPGLGSTQLQYQASKQASLSGSPSLPIQGSNSSNQGLSVDSRFEFGAQRQYDFTNLITFNTQAYELQGQAPIPERREGRLFLDLRGRYSSELQCFAFFNHSASDQGDLSSRVNSLAAGANYNPRPEISASASMHADQNQTRQLSSKTRGMDGSVRLQKTLPLGVLQASYAVRYDQREQIATASQTDVIGERLTLIGSSYVVLAQQHANPLSVVLVNVARTQTFGEGVDYVLTQVGTETRVQRLIGGAILDGQDLLVDYSYDLGGTYASSQTDQTLNLNWSLGSYFNAYFRYLDSAPKLESGVSSFPLNAVRSNLYGMRADVPFKAMLQMILGGSLEREDRRETLAPYRRSAEELYAQVEDPFFAAGNYRVAARRTRVVYDNSLQNVNLRGYDARYWVRFLSGVELSVNLNAESDTGGLLERRRLVSTAKAEWNYRKLKMTFDVGRTLETQGDFRRAPVLLQLQVRRDF